MLIHQCTNEIIGLSIHSWNSICLLQVPLQPPDRFKWIPCTGSTSISVVYSRRAINLYYRQEQRPLPKHFVIKALTPIERIKCPACLPMVLTKFFTRFFSYRTTTMHLFNIFTAAFSLLNIGRGVLGVPNPNSEHNLVERQARTTPILTGMCCFLCISECANAFF